MLSAVKFDVAENLFHTLLKTTNLNETSFNVIENADVNLALQLGSTEPYAYGKLESHCVRGTGLQAYSSLNLVQEVMLDQIVDVCGERNDAEAL